jgi:hypothetical protein
MRLALAHSLAADKIALPVVFVADTLTLEPFNSPLLFIPDCQVRLV